MSKTICFLLCLIFSLTLCNATTNTSKTFLGNTITQNIQDDPMDCTLDYYPPVVGSTLSDYANYEDVEITYSSIDQTLKPDLVNLLKADLTLGTGQGWNSGNYAPAWIKVRLLNPRKLQKLTLVANILPDCIVNYTVEIDNGTAVNPIYKSHHIATNDQIGFDTSSYGLINSITIRTTQSKSWIAWKRILLQQTTLPPVPATPNVRYDEVEITYSTIYSNSVTDVVHLLDPNLTLGTGQGWNSGNYAPAWIKITLKNPIKIKKLYLVANIFPNCDESYSVEIEHGAIVTACSKTQFITTGDLIDFDTSAYDSIKSIKVTVTHSLSWIAWKRILLLK